MSPWRLLLIAAAVGLILAQVVITSSLFDGLALTAPPMIVAAVALHRGGQRHPRMWRLLLAYAILHSIGGVLWSVAPDLVPLAGPGGPALADVTYWAGDLALTGALLGLLVKREGGLVTALDVLTLFASFGLLAGVALVGPDLAKTTLPSAEIATQLGYIACDLLLASAAVRVLVAVRPRVPSANMLGAGAMLFVASDLIWNWLTIAGGYAPGGWADLGWTFGPLLIAAALRHSTWVQLSPRTDSDQRLDRGPLLISVALVCIPLVFVADEMIGVGFEESDAAVWTVAGGGCALSVLMFVRMSLIVRRHRALRAVLADALAAQAHARERSDERYQHLVEQLPALVYSLTYNDEGAVVAAYASPQAGEVTGISPKLWESPEVADRINPDDLPMVRFEMSQTLAHGIGNEYEFRITREDGTEAWLRDTGARCVEVDGLRVLQGLVFDVTAAKAAEASRDQMETELRLAQKLEAVGQLAAGIAHEINTPIQYVGDTLHFVREGVEDVFEVIDTYGQLRDAARGLDGLDPEVIARVERAEDIADLEYLRERVPAAFERGSDGLERVATIVKAMREFGHPGGGEHRPVDVNQAINNTLVVARNEYKYVADAELDLGDVPAVLGDISELNQVFLNLVVNAAQAIAETCDGANERGQIRLTTRQSGDYVRISIADTGGGIPEHIGERVYDPFFTTKDVGVGTGQGLAITRAILERHNGTITYSTRPGEGTEFSVTLPRAQAAPVGLEAVAT